MILAGDCIDRMRELDAESVDAIVTDPPYGLEFMGKEWDRLSSPLLHGEDNHRPTDETGRSTGLSRWSLAAPHYRAGLVAQEWHQAWATEALRVLKPGGHLLAFGGTRTYHRLACAVEDAGFEIRDSLIWLYGSGFPKSLDVGKALDKAAGVEREVVGPNRYASRASDDPGMFQQAVKIDLTAPATPEAQQWQGWGTALKPAHEPIVVARKPLAGTVAANVLEHGTGALNIDGCRIEGGPSAGGSHSGREGTREMVGEYGYDRTEIDRELVNGRWPANVALSHLPECERVGTRTVKSSEGVIRRESGSDRQGNTGAAYGAESRPAGTPVIGYGTESIPAYSCAPGCPVAELDRQSGERGIHGAGAAQEGREMPTSQHIPFKGETNTNNGMRYGDTGGASRFMYQAKASRAERNAGLDGFEEREGQKYGSIRSDRGAGYPDATPIRNAHPTVKPIDLMRWLVRLVTPPGGTVLDPFTGSGTTGIAAHLEGFDFIGIEREAEYREIAEARIAWWSGIPAGTDTEAALGLEGRERAVRESGQMGLLDAS